MSPGTSFYKRGILQGTCPPGWPVIAIKYSLRQSVKHLPSMSVFRIYPHITMSDSKDKHIVVDSQGWSLINGSSRVYVYSQLGLRL